MNELKKVDHAAWEWLRGHNPKLWCKHAFPYYPKCDILMNNIYESLNATILLVRDKPILTMAKWIRTYIMNKISTLRSNLSRWQHNIMLMLNKRLNTEIQKADNWVATWGISEEFEVEMIGGGQRFTMHMGKRTCSCNFWELVGIPCRYAIVAMSKRDQNLEDYVYEWYTKSKYEACYNFNVTVINDQDMRPEVECDEMFAPAYRKGPGKPKKLRRRGHDEPAKSCGKFSRAVIKYKCTRCGSSGHNARGCKSETVNPEAQKRKVFYCQSIYHICCQFISNYIDLHFYRGNQQKSKIKTNKKVKHSLLKIKHKLLNKHKLLKFLKLGTLIQFKLKQVKVGELIKNKLLKAVKVGELIQFKIRYLKCKFIQKKGR